MQFPKLAAVETSCVVVALIENYIKKKVKQSRYRPEVDPGFQEDKVPRFHDNGAGWW